MSRCEELDNENDLQKRTRSHVKASLEQQGEEGGLRCSTVLV